MDVKYPEIKLQHNATVWKMIDYLKADGHQIFDQFVVPRTNIKFTPVLLGGAAIKYHLSVNPESPYKDDDIIIYTQDIDLKFAFCDVEHMYVDGIQMVVNDKRSIKEVTDCVMEVKEKILEYLSKKLETGPPKIPYDFGNKAFTAKGVMKWGGTSYAQHPYYLRSLLITYESKTDHTQEQIPILDTSIYNTDGVHALLHYYDFRRTFYNKETGYPLEFVKMENMNVASLKFLIYDTFRMYIYYYNELINASPGVVIDKNYHTVKKMVSYAFKIMVLDLMYKNAKPNGADDAKNEPNRSLFDATRKQITKIIGATFKDFKDLKDSLDALSLVVRDSYLSRYPATRKLMLGGAVGGVSAAAAAAIRRPVTARGRLLAPVAGAVSKKVNETAKMVQNQKQYAMEILVGIKLLENKELQTIVKSLPCVAKYGYVLFGGTDKMDYTPRPRFQKK